MANISGFIKLKEFQDAVAALPRQDQFADTSEDDFGLDDIKMTTQYDRVESAIKRQLASGGIGTKRKITDKDQPQELLQDGKDDIEDGSFMDEAYLPSNMPSYLPSNIPSPYPSENSNPFQFQKPSAEPSKLQTKPTSPTPSPSPSAALVLSDPAIETESFLPVNSNEIVITISFYHPQRNIKMQEFVVLGSQPLSVLRDKFYCLSDYVADGRDCKSAMFAIENVCYDDMRTPTNVQYSQNIIEWVRDRRRVNQGFQPLTAASMEGTCFIDLTVRLGMQYLYLHQGNCEHHMVITAVRAIHETDQQNLKAYPLTTYQCKIRRRKCRVCDIYPARWVVYGDRLSDENPCFFCNHCYRPLHYTADGNLLHQYEVFPYFHE